MSQVSVEVIRRLLEAFNWQDASAVADLWAPDGEWRPAYIGGGLLEGAVFRGAEGAVEFVEVQSEAWESVIAEPVEMQDLGGTVPVAGHLSGGGRGGGRPGRRGTRNRFRGRHR